MGAPAGANASESAQPSSTRVAVQVLGQPAVIDRDGALVQGMRHHATQLLVFLAVHRAGADLDDIMEAFWPDATVRRASERLSTEVANLRRAIRAAAADPGLQPVINTGGRYHLNPDVVDVDLWTLQDAARDSATATDPDARVALLQQAISADTGILAEGADYDWIEPAREQTRRRGITARLHLADLTAATDPARAADLTWDATRLDPLSDDLTRRAMRAHAAAGRHDTLKVLLQRLRTALQDIDEEPAAETLALAAHLRTTPTGTSNGAPPSTRHPEVPQHPTETTAAPAASTADPTTRQEPAR